MQCLLWRCVLVLSALRAVLQAVVQSAVLRSCASRPCALQHSGGTCAAPRNLLFPGASAAPLHAHLCVQKCAEPYTHVQRLPRTHACAFTHTCKRILAQPCVRTPFVCTQVCAKPNSLVQRPSCTHSCSCIHTHACTPSFCTPTCTNTRAQLQPCTQPSARTHVQNFHPQTPCTRPRAVHTLMLSTISAHPPVCTHTCTHSSRTKCRTRGTANTQAVGNVRRKGAPLRSFILLSLMQALGHSWSPILRCGLLRGSSSVGYGGPGMVMGVLSGTVGVGEHRRGLRHKGRSEPPSNRRDP